MRAAWTLAVLLAAGPAVADEPKPVNLPLTVFDVLQLAQQGAPEDAILARLRDTNTTCTLSPNDVSMLKLFGVSDRVVKAMAGPPAPVRQYASDPPKRVASIPAAEPPAAPPAKPTSSKPAGSWVRDVGPLSVRLAFTDDRVTGEATLDQDGERVTISFDADYTVNREGLLYGVVTGVDADDPEGAAFVQAFAGHTFSLRCRCEGDVLSVREVKFCGSGLKEDDEITQIALAAAGRYRKDDGKPRPKPDGRKLVARTAPPADAVVPATRREVVPGPGPGQTYERMGLDFNTLPPGVVVPTLPPGVFTPPPAPRVGTGAGPMIGNAPLPFAPIPPPPPAAVGTWVRERPGVRVTMKLTDRRLKVDVAMAVQEGKDVQRGTWHLDADCAIGPDGSVFGVITGVDLAPTDDTPAEKAGDVAAVAATGSKLVGEMFRFRFRAEDGELSVRELKVSLPEGKMDDEAQATMTLVFGGRYKTAGTKELPPVKPGVVLPGGPTHVTPERIHGGILE